MSTRLYTRGCGPSRADRSTTNAAPGLVALRCLTGAAFLTRPPLPAWAVSSGGRVTRIVLVGLRPGLYAVGLLAVATLLLPAAGIAIAQPGLLGLLTLAGGLTLLTLYQALAALAPQQAATVAAGLVQLQFAAIPGHCPSTPLRGDQDRNHVLPLPALLGALNRAVLGGDQSSPPVTMVVLLRWTVAGLLTTRSAISRSYRAPAPRAVLAGA